MKRSVFVVAILLAFVLVGFMGKASAGIEPSPFEPELNKLHSIELNVAAINKRLEKLDTAEALPQGVGNYLQALTNQMDGLKVRLQEVMGVLPERALSNPYIGEDDVIMSLKSIGLDSRGAFDLLENIVSRMGVGPSPFLPVFTNISADIIEGITFHILPVLNPGEPMGRSSYTAFTALKENLRVCQEYGQGHQWPCFFFFTKTTPCLSSV